MMNNDFFWQTIENIWESIPELNEKRKNALKTNNEDLILELSGEMCEESFLNNFGAVLSKLNKEYLTEFIRTMEERLYNIDRDEIHEYTDGSDDGFLYCRCFIVGMGREYYEKIDKKPSEATMDAETEPVGFVAYTIYEDLFGEEFERNTIHCIESGSNHDSWS
jgi:hypothetical protein